MSEDDIPYLKVRAVRDETGASHEECRQVLRDSDGDVPAAVTLWFERRRGGAPSAAPGSAPDVTGPDESQTTRSQ